MIRFYRARVVVAAILVAMAALGVAAIFGIFIPDARYHEAMDAGHRAEKARDWDAAFQAYGRAELLRPNDLYANRALRRVEFYRDRAFYSRALKQASDAERNGDWQSAATAYEEALRWRPNDAWATTGRNYALYHLEMQQGRVAEQSQNWLAAELAYNRALAYRPHDAEALASLARLPKEKRPLLALTKPAPPIAEVPSSIPVPAPFNGKLPEVKVHLERRRQAVPHTDAPLAQPSAASVTDYLLWKTGDASITVNAIPSTDVNAWALAGQYESKATDTSSLYRLVGEHLLIADHLLKDPDLAQRRRGLAFALQAVRGARKQLKDYALASAIADAFLLPSLAETADERATEWLSRINVIEEACAAYKLARDPARQAIGYQLMLEHAPNRNTADFASYQLAQLSVKSGDGEQALKLLRSIDPNHGGMAGVRRLIPGIEKKLQLDKPKGGIQP